ncbi:hypothetical protein PR202_gb07991 [Eleusine coracana subsp. coracana]|uniref:Senescence regulator n=1 Tax=Eleusine coracana subsp. coracana TaxID=191504 RepID=A0AAV5EEL3_ELECO|nr:hypothetical protein QOZ80_2BG0179850 [Eleusine coracana subsp. coracana]GJN20596.1 hypothetical protein PR202_gb07991 [Eleusine coracana subsp. coracana]
MDAGSRPRRSPPSDRFLGLFSSPSPSLPASSPSAGDELLEGDLLFPAPSSPSDPPPDASKDPVRVPRGHLGLLAALHEGDRRLPGRSGAVSVAAAGTAGTLLRRKATIAAAAAAASSVTPSQSPSSIARAIPASPRPRDPDLPPAAPFHQSAPVQVPVPPRRRRGRGWGELTGGACDDDDEEELFSGDAAMLPPHEMVARASAGGSYGVPGKPSSMLEGAGRTLKGRDLRRVRDAVLRQTGFLD